MSIDSIARNAVETYEGQTFCDSDESKETLLSIIKTAMRSYEAENMCLIARLKCAGDYMSEYVSDRRRLIWADVKNEPTQTP